mgnify:CR=1 FL=1
MVGEVQPGGLDRDDSGVGGFAGRGGEGVDDGGEFAGVAEEFVKGAFF